MYRKSISSLTKRALQNRIENRTKYYRKIYTVKNCIQENVINIQGQQIDLSENVLQQENTIEEQYENNNLDDHDDQLEQIENISIDERNDNIGDQQIEILEEISIDDSGNVSSEEIIEFCISQYKDYDNSELQNMSVIEFMSKWANDFNVSRISLNVLLKYFQQHYQSYQLIIDHC